MLLKHPTQQTILYQLLACLDPIIVSYLHTDFLKYLHHLEAQVRSRSDHVTKVESTSTPDGTSSCELARGSDLQILRYCHSCLRNCSFIIYIFRRLLYYCNRRCARGFPQSPASVCRSLLCPFALFLAERRTSPNVMSESSQA
jgi:hypothetical protein